jgi:hypothetical protein
VSRALETDAIFRNSITEIAVCIAYKFVPHKHSCPFSIDTVVVPPIMIRSVGIVETTSFDSGPPHSAYETRAETRVN